MLYLVVVNFVTTYLEHSYFRMFTFICFSCADGGCIFVGCKSGGVKSGAKPSLSCIHVPIKGCQCCGLQNTSPKKLATPAGADSTNKVASTTPPQVTSIPPGPSQTSKNPIMLLNELRQGVEYTLRQESGEPHAKTFTFQVTVDGQLFEGTGKS